MTKSEIGGRWLDNFTKLSHIWLTFWRGVGRFLPESLSTKWLLFWKNIGYGLSSSQFLIDKMLTYVDWHSPLHTIVELGGGSGPMTRAIIARKLGDTNFTVCEIERDRYVGLQHLEDAHIKVLHLDAETFLPSSVDLIISTLPLGSMPRDSARQILKATRDALTPNGLYIQYQYFATNKKDVEEFFSFEKVDWEALNFPPAFIYICKKR